MRGDAKTKGDAPAIITCANSATAPPPERVGSPP